MAGEPGAGEESTVSAGTPPQSATAPDTDGEPPGLLLTHARRYNAMVAVLFGGRRSALDAWLVRAAGVRPGDRVLDVGCGPGRLVRRLARAAGPSGAVVGADPSGPMLDHARRHAARLPTASFHRAPAQDLGLPDASFDVVTSTFVLHHVPPGARAAALGEMCRVLRPGGRLLLVDAYPTGALGPRVARLMSRVSRHRSGRHHSDRQPREHSGHSGHSRLSGGSGGSDGSGYCGHPVDPFADTDVRAHLPTLRTLGLTDLYTADRPPWTRCLRAVKPDGKR